MKRRLVFALLCFVAACRRDSAYDDAVRELRSGNLKAAERIIDSTERTPPFRLLKAELLLAQGDSEQALAVLSEPGAGDADLLVRRQVLRAEALTRLARYDAAARALDEAESLAATTGAGPGSALRSAIALLRAAFQ